MKKEAKTRQPFKIDLGIILLITGASANITLWIGAFVSSETAGPVGTWIQQWLLPILGGISGLAMAFTVAVGIVYVIAKLNTMKPTIERKARGKKGRIKRMPNIRYYIGWGVIVLLLVISLVLLSPVVYMALSGVATLFLVLGDWAGLWSVVRVLAADLAVGAVALVQGVHLPTSAPAKAPTSTATRTTQSDSQAVRTAKGAKASATTETTAAKELRPCDVPECGIPYKWPQGKGAHYKQYHKDLVIQKGIPARVSLPLQEVKKEGKQS
jgi:hypothetical protein